MSLDLGAYYFLRCKNATSQAEIISHQFKLPHRNNNCWKGQINVICLDKFGIGSNDLGIYSDKYSVCLDKLPIRVRTNMGICTDEQAFCLDE